MEATIPENKFVSFSYENYLTSAVDSFKEIKTTENLIYTENLTFEKEISIIKNQYRTFSNESKEDLVANFNDKIIKWFTKIWSFLCDIFSKIYEIIISLIKALIIFVQKKKLQAHNIVKQIEEKGLVGYNAANNDVITKILNSNKKIKMIDLKVSNFKSTSQNSAFGPYKFINDCLVNRELEEFINSSIILRNPNSIFNTDSLKKYLDKDLDKDDVAEDKKLEILLNATETLYAEAIISNEVDPNHRKPSVLIDKYSTIINAKNMSELSHNLVFGFGKPSYTEMSLTEFFGLEPNAKFNVENLKYAFRQFYEDTKLVLGDKGYINTLQETLKKYKDQAKKDSVNIKIMQKTILDYLNKIGVHNDGNKERMSHRFSKFTEIVMKIKSIKSHFIRLRQCVILDIISLFSIENEAWCTLTGNGSMFKKEDEITDVSQIKDEPIFMNTENNYHINPLDE